MTRRVGLLGANGYLGRHLALKLRADPELRVGLGDRHPNSKDGHEGYAPIDVREAAAVRKFVEGCDRVFFFSGRTGTAQGFEDFREFVETNEIGLLNVLDACRRQASPPRVILPSTRLVYKGRENTPLKEDDAKEPKTVYAMNKDAGERYLRMHADNFKVPHTVFRICVPYGSLLPGGQSYGTLNHFLTQARAGDVTVFGDGRQKRTFVHIEDLMGALVLGSSAAATENGVFNVGGADVMSIRQVAEKVALRFGRRVKEAPWPPAAEAVEPGDTIFDSSKLDGLLGIGYRRSFEEWVKGLVV